MDLKPNKPHFNQKHGHRRRGQKRSPTYNSWRSMKDRCNQSTHKDWLIYGGRGITVCQRWLGNQGFQNFLDDMGERLYNTTLDRIDPNGNYEPENCRWADPKTQAQNQRRNSRSTQTDSM